MLTLGVHVLDPEATRNWAYLKAARATTNATSYMARFLPDLQERKADWDIVLKAMDDGQQLVDLVHQVALFAPSDEITRAEQAARSIFRARGFELTNDTMMMTQALIGSPNRSCGTVAPSATPCGTTFVRVRNRWPPPATSLRSKSGQPTIWPTAVISTPPKSNRPKRSRTS